MPDLIFSERSKMDSIACTLESVEEDLRNNSTLAYRLRLLSQTIYKYHSAQRQQKFYHAMCKMEKNMLKFLHFKLPVTAKGNRGYIESLEDDTSPDNNAIVSSIHFSELLRSAYRVLQKAAGNCMECAIHSFGQLAIEHFISLHTFLVALSSGIFSSIKDLMLKIESWYNVFSSTLKLHGKIIPNLPDNMFDFNRQVQIDRRVAKGSDKLLRRLFGTCYEKTEMLDVSRETGKDKENLSVCSPMTRHSENTREIFRSTQPSVCVTNAENKNRCLPDQSCEEVAGVKDSLPLAKPRCDVGISVKRKSLSSSKGQSAVSSHDQCEQMRASRVSCQSKFSQNLVEVEGRNTYTRETVQPTRVQRNIPEEKRRNAFSKSANDVMLTAPILSARFEGNRRKSPVVRQKKAHKRHFTSKGNLKRLNIPLKHKRYHLSFFRYVRVRNNKSHL